MREDLPSLLGKTVTVVIDRPIGSTHPRHPDMVYPVHYGYIPGMLAEDGEEQDVYLLGVEHFVKEYRAQIIGIIHRRDDVEDKLVAAPAGMYFTKEEIEAAVWFQERYFDSVVEVIGSVGNGLDRSIV